MPGLKGLGFEVSGFWVLGFVVEGGCARIEGFGVRGFWVLGFRVWG